MLKTEWKVKHESEFNQHFQLTLTFFFKRKKQDRVVARRAAGNVFIIDGENIKHLTITKKRQVENERIKQEKENK